jgi:chitinase
MYLYSLNLDLSQGYIACITRLRSHFAENPAKKYFITGAPQCSLPEANMGNMIQAAQFDILWIQFYDNPTCSARAWANANADYAVSKQEVASGFNYNEWKSIVNSGASAGAQMYIGLEAQIAGCTAATYGDYINATEANNLISAYQTDSAFGGVMIWEATLALNDACNCGEA